MQRARIRIATSRVQKKRVQNKKKNRISPISILIIATKPLVILISTSPNQPPILAYPSTHSSSTHSSSTHYDVDGPGNHNLSFATPCARRGRLMKRWQDHFGRNPPGMTASHPSSPGYGDVSSLLTTRA